MLCQTAKIPGMIQRFPKLSLAQFKRLAASLGHECRGYPLTIGLIGPLGAGKTTFVQNFAQSLGVKKIKSPTFTIINSFRLPQRNFYHIDFYRLAKASELEPLGILPILKQKNDLVIMEWIDKFPRLKKYCGLVIKIALSEHPHKRNVTVQKN